MIDSFAILSHGFGRTPDGSGTAYDITLEDDVFTLEDEA